MPAISAGSTYYQQFTSYGANQGTYPGTWQQSYGTAEFAQYNGVFILAPSRRPEHQGQSLMPKSFLAILLAAAGLTAGCGCPALSSLVFTGTHGGTTFRLPNEKGFVELVNEPVVTDRRNPQPTTIVAYFFQADGKSAMSPSPTDVSFQIDPDARSRPRGKSAAGSSTLPLSAEPKADDPAGASRFASKTGPYYLAGVRGTLKAKISDQGISTAFMGAR